MERIVEVGKTWITQGGNIVRIHAQTNTKVQFERLGYRDDSSGYETWFIHSELWAVLPKDTATLAMNQWKLW